jgi:ABC-type iron transport system FetAB ATPase subunit
VSLSLELPVPALPDLTTDVLVLRDVSGCARGRSLFREINLRLGRRRVAVIGPSGACSVTLTVSCREASPFSSMF